MDGLFKEFEKIQLLGTGGGDFLDIFQPQQQQNFPVRGNNGHRRILLDAGPAEERSGEAFWLPEASWPSNDDVDDQEHDESYRVFLEEQMAIENMPCIDDVQTPILPIGIFFHGMNVDGSVR